MNTCIIWSGRKWSQGRYGMDVLNGKSMGAHRAAWIRTHGPIPKGLVVCHKCDNGLCVNVDHLFLGTMSENMQDCKRKGRFSPPPNNNQKGANNRNARPDYFEIRVKAKRLRSAGYTYKQIRSELNIKSNGHLVTLLK